MTKIEKLLELYQIQLNELMTEVDAYSNFIKFAAPLYKYPFSEVVLIYAQRPEATLCAEFEFWTTKMGLSLKGAKGIPVIRNFYGQNRITYLFDIVDVTTPSGKALPVAWNTNGIDASMLTEIIDHENGSLFDRVCSRITGYVEQVEDCPTKHELETAVNKLTLSRTAQQLIAYRVGIAPPYKTVYPLYESKKIFITSNNILFAAARAEVATIKKEIDNRRNGNEHIEKAATGTGTSDPRRSHTGGEYSAEPHTRSIRNAVDTLPRGEATFAGDGAANDRQPLQSSAREGVGGAEANSTHSRAAADGEKRLSAHRFHGKSAVGKPVENIRRGVGEGKVDDRLQLTLFSDKSSTPDLATTAVAVTESPQQVKAFNNDKQPNKPAPIPDSIPLAANYRIEEPDILFPSGPKQKYNRNVAAIHLLKGIESRGTPATSEEQAVLTLYSGWGGIPQAFDPNNQKWTEEYQQLHGLLSEDEYNLARASTLNAHYTSPTVITAMYHTLHRMGFRQGKILEPAVGVGYFFGLLPEEMQDCTLHGVELDSVTGRIAQILYPQAKIQIRGFQDTKYADGEFDVLVGNVPFGDYNISDDRYSMHIHDYFFVRGLDKLRTGGIMAFITSKGTLDKLGNEVRRMIAQRADLLGAIRLPNTAFKEIAGTEVTTDIIFLQKRAQPPEEYPDWVFVEEYPDNPEIIINSYFAANPQMLLGTMVPRSGMYGGKDTALVPAPDWEKKLWEAVDSIGGQYLDSPKMPTNAPKNALVDLPYDDTVARFTYCVRGAYLYYNDGVMLRHQSFDSKKTSRIQHMDTIRTAVREVIAVQCEEHFQDALLKAAQDRLGVLYDRFVKEYGYINARANQLAFSEDIDIALISSLETPNEDGSYSKTEFFSEATIKQTTPITFADNAVDALLISLNQRGNVDMEYMQSLTGFTKEKILTDLEDRVYIDHRSNAEMPRYLSSDEYLSGDVRTALSEVKTLVPDRTELRRNLVALEQVQPDWIPAVDIGVRLSSHWVGQETITQFIHELLDTPRYQRNPDFNGCIVANYSRTSNEWNISNKSQHNSVITNSKYGTTRIGAYAIIESTLNQREITIRDPYEEEGKTKYQYNHEETVLARQKQELIQECFRDWIFADTDRRNRLEHIYNYTFNRIQPRVFDGSYITLPETNPLIRLRPHQLNGIARIRTGSNVLLGHVVGAGKTFTMVAGGMELLRLGVSHKLLYVVPNHIIGDFASDFLRLYPNARILVPGERDFQKGNRHRFVAKIATANIEAIIIGHSQFEKLDITPERKAKEIDKEIDSLTHAIENAESSDAPRYTIKQLEKSKQALTDRMKALLTSKDKDTMLYFEQLGVDGLFIDEAHNYKNGALHSKMSNIAGVPSGSSLKSADLLAKLRYIGEIDGSVVFATGTFISNSICEMYIMQRYLQEPTLHAKDICHFDEWASIFGETVTSLEVKPEGGGYRTNTRFSQFYNLPELMSMFGEVADIQTAEMLNLPRPVLVGGKPVVIDCAPSPELQEFMDNCVIRAKNIRSGAVKSFEDNMLKLTNEARKAGTDMRLLSEENCFDPNGKLAMCAQQIAQNLRNSDAIKGTVLVFSDIGTPSSSFNVYDELRRLLILNGVDAADIAYIHEAKNDKAKKRLFEEMRSGAKRVLIGSTAKCGAGTNIQDRMVALHHLDCPWRPSDIEQREGRILRQGNMNKEVYIYRYVTRRSFDSYLWQLVEQKQRFISQIMNGKNAGRSCKDIDETVLSFAEVKAIASGDPRIKESMELQMDIEKLIVLKNQYTKEQYRLQDLIKTTYPKKKNQLLLDMEEVGADLDAKSAYSDEFAIEIGGASYSERTKAGDALQDKLLGCKPKFGEELEVGSYRGLQLLFCATFGGNVLRLRGRHSYSIEMGDSPLGNIRKIENRIDSAKELLQSLTEQLEKLETDMTNAQQQLSLPFSKAHELSEKQQQLIALTAEINVATGQVAENVSEATMSQ